MNTTTTCAAARTSITSAEQSTAANEVQSTLAAPGSMPMTGPRTPSAIVAQLWEAAAPNLTREQLQWLARSGSEAFESAQHLCRVMTGVGCLMASDSSGGRVGAGSFRDGADALQLLTVFSDALDGISSMMYVADAAVSELVAESPGE